MKERLDNRVLGALRWIDGVTGTPIDRPLPASCDGLSLLNNRSNLCVILAAQGLGDYGGAYDPNTLSPAQKPADKTLSFATLVQDPLGDYLPRLVTVQLPRPLTPQGTPDSTFDPLDVVLLPSPVRNAAAGWARLRLSATRADGSPFANVLFRVQRSSAPQTLLGRGLSDARGEALVLIPGLKLFEPGQAPNEVVTSETEVSIQAFEPPGTDAVVDWTLLEAGVPKTAPHTLKLKAGGSYSLGYPFPP
jgi:hypothetical protein